MKIDVGPGYRVNYVVRREELIILLGGGDKSSQSQDIDLAYRLAHGLEA
jgi:putative addiction module killer protein